MAMQTILQPYYIYDPNVGDELGGLRVKADEKKGKFVLATPQQMQYWIDQGLAGEKPVGEISGAAKALLAQITRGRSEDNDAQPKRVPKYNREAQRGAPSLAGQPLRVRVKKAAKKKAKDDKPPKKPEAKKNPDGSVNLNG